MRIFKNRGDIFFSKTNKKKSTEQKLLLTSLIFIVIFTIAFVLFTAVKNDFSIKTFFKPDNFDDNKTTVSQELALPQLSGKSNFVIMITDEDRLLFSYLIQVDKETTAYKLTTLRRETIVDSQPLYEIFASSGEKNTLRALSSLLDTPIDYYACFEKNKFIDIFDEFSSVKYPFIEDIKYKNNDSFLPYSIRVKEGEQTIRGGKAVDLIRYYLDTGKMSLANDFLLNCLVQQVTSDNYAKKEQLFQLLVKNSTTNITVRDFSQADDAMMVFSSELSGVKLYNVPVKYSKSNKITQKSIKELKDYFTK